MKNQTSFKKGHIQSLLSRKKMSIAKLGNIPWNKGTKGVVKAWNKGIKTNLPSWMTGKKHTEESKQKNRNKHLGKPSWNKGKSNYWSIGDKNCNWKGGVSKLNKTLRQLAMETIDYKLWRSSVFERDNYTCIECKQHGIKLEADHIKPWIDFPELRYKVDNGRTLCKECHKKIGWSLFREKNPRKEKQT